MVGSGEGGVLGGTGEGEVQRVVMRVGCRGRVVRVGWGLW